METNYQKLLYARSLASVLRWENILHGYPNAMIPWPGLYFGIALRLSSYLTASTLELQSECGPCCSVTSFLFAWLSQQKENIHLCKLRKRFSYRLIGSVFLDFYAISFILFLLSIFLELGLKKTFIFNRSLLWDWRWTSSYDFRTFESRTKHK